MRRALSLCADDGNTKTKKALTKGKLGDAYCFVANRANELILAGNPGRRSVGDTEVFISKLDRGRKGEFQSTADGFGPFRDAGFILGARTDFAQLVKVRGDA